MARHFRFFWGWKIVGRSTHSRPLTRPPACPSMSLGARRLHSVNPDKEIGGRRGERPTIRPQFMGRPPRVPVMLPWECRVIYFLTVCVIPRRNALANDAAWRALCQTLKRLDKWNTYCVLMMPDHIHLLTAPIECELSVAAFLKWLKRWFNEFYDFPRPCRWQSGGFDRLLRTSESIYEKWNYIRENPVRAGLVQHWKQWPYQKGFFDDEI
jgi:putative transposase